VHYHSIILEEMDLDAALARRAEVALVDELATPMSPAARTQTLSGCGGLLAAGIHVISTLNIQHLESLYDAVRAQIG